VSLSVVLPKKADGEPIDRKPIPLAHIFMIWIGMSNNPQQSTAISFDIRQKRHSFWTSRFLLEEFLNICQEKSLTPSLKNFTLWMRADCDGGKFNGVHLNDRIERNFSND
jgi:hypothetical protein